MAKQFFFSFSRLDCFVCILFQLPSGEDALTHLLVLFSPVSEIHSFDKYKKPVLYLLSVMNVYIINKWRKKKKKTIFEQWDWLSGSLISFFCCLLMYFNWLKEQIEKREKIEKLIKYYRYNWCTMLVENTILINVQLNV